MPPFKDELGLALAKRLAGELRRAWPEFPTRRFMHRLGGELEALELVARSDLLAERLAQSLPKPFPDAAEVLWRALDSPPFSGGMTLPCGTFVATAGIDEPDVALPLLAGLTPRWSSESAVRPFIERHPGVTYGYLHRWC